MHGAIEDLHFSVLDQEGRAVEKRTTGKSEGVECIEKLYGRLVAWLAREAAHDFPEATHVRVLYLRSRTPTPEQQLAGELPTPKKQRAKVRKLEELR